MAGLNPDVADRSDAHRMGDESPTRRARSVAEQWQLDTSELGCEGELLLDGRVDFTMARLTHGEQIVDVACSVWREPDWEHVMGM